MKDAPAVLVVTTPDVAGHRVVQVMGEVFGIVVRSRGIGGQFMAGLRSIGGGEIHEYTVLVEETRAQAIARMARSAELKGGNAVLAMRFDSGDFGGTMNEVVAYGTAARVEPL